MQPSPFGHLEHRHNSPWTSGQKSVSSNSAIILRTDTVCGMNNSSTKLATDMLMKIIESLEEIMLKIVYSVPHSLALNGSLSNLYYYYYLGGMT